MSNEDFLNIVADLLAKMMKNLVPKGTSKMKLSEFSRVLTNFEEDQTTEVRWTKIPC